MVGNVRVVEHPQGTTILVLGILGLVACQVCAPFAWVMGNRAKEETDRYPGYYSNAGLIQAGRICGIVGTVILIGTVLLFVIYLFFIIAVIGGTAAGA